MVGKGFAGAACGCLLIYTSVAHSTTVISELFYDASGGDNGKVFVELSGVAGTSLDGYSLLGINGGDGTTYKTVGLSGVIPGDGFFVIGDDDGGGATAVPEADLIAQVDFQNGPDSVVLWDGSQVVDAVGYGDFAGLHFAGEGMSAADVPAGQSLARLAGASDTDNNRADFVPSSLPTPGYAMAAPVPIPGSMLTFVAGLLLFSHFGRPQPDKNSVI